MENASKIDRLKTLLECAEHAVFFGGAGVSVPSGIPDFRSPDGLAGRKYKYPFEVILSHDFFFEHTTEFWDYFFKELDKPGVRPNAAHTALAELEKRGRIKAVITQNIDGLHQAAGSRNVYELHGTASRGHCVRCGAEYSAEDIRARAPFPKCDCGGLIKPDVVLYGEQLPAAAVEGACAELCTSDLVIVAGTSLSVYPAAGFLRLTRGRIAVLNKTETAGSPVEPFLSITGDVRLLAELV